MFFKHKKVSAVADTADTTLTQPSDWNAGHSFDVTIPLGGLAVLTNVGASYDAVNASRGLGFVETDWTGVTQIIFTVKVNKVGTGTQSWQLWNETNAAQIGVIDDAGAAGNKTLTTTLTAGLPTGVKVLRIRCKSTVSTDDPLYYGANLRVSG